MDRRHFAALAVLCSTFAGGGAGCGAANEGAPAPVAKSAGAKLPAVKMLTPSRLVPELDTRHLASWYSEPGVEKHLLGGMRILVHDSGEVERATERFPSGTIQAMALPVRLGSGYLFYQSDSQGTRIWRADSWVGKLKPLALLGPTTQEILAGFDRLYLRTRSNKLMALDAQSGAILPRGTLPTAPRLGRMVFADGWRAVVDTDLRGPLASFDAGVSWRPLDIPSNIQHMAVIDGDPVLNVAAGSYRVDARGHVQFIAFSPTEDADEDDGPASSGQSEHPLGERPLRTTLTRGWPDSPQSGVVLHEGTLYRVALGPNASRAEVLGRAKTEVPENARCQGARIGTSFGFICGEEEGATTILQFVPPLGVTPVATFDNPRFVSPSGNGLLVIRGACQGDGADTGEMRTYCILSKAGKQREIAVRGEIGAERVVALDDGRVVVLVPPRFGRPGRLTLIDGDKVTGKDLTYPEEPRRAVKVARRGLWLEGFQQRGKKAIGGWVEAGGPAIGVSITFDGKVKLGKVYDEGGQLLVAGSFAVATSDAETGLESTDGGMTWKEFELPRLPESSGDSKTRGCSPLGCALRGWLRVGWGKPQVEDDLARVAAPKTVTVKTRIRPSMEIDCHFVSPPPKLVEHKSVGSAAPYSSWTPFRNSAPPKLGKDELGVDKASQYYNDVGAHVYVWGSKGADWSRSGWWQIRFDDPFATTDPVRMSALTRPPWSDEVSASEAIGARHHSSYWRWEASIDPSGTAALVNLCTGSRCEHYAVSQGRPVLELRPPKGAASSHLRPVPNGVVRVGESWYILTESHAGGTLTLWRADLGVLKQALTFRRLFNRNFQGNVITPQLVRRALGAEIGIMFSEPADPATGGVGNELVVLPIDPLEKRLASPVVLGPRDLDGNTPPPCAEHDDGWIIDTSLPTSPDINLEGISGYIDDVRLRLRLEPGKTCIEGIAARSHRAFHSSDPKAAPAAATIPMSVRERYTGNRWGFMCAARK